MQDVHVSFLSDFMQAYPNTSIPQKMVTGKQLICCISWFHTVIPLGPFPHPISVLSCILSASSINNSPRILKFCAKWPPRCLCHEMLHQPPHQLCPLPSPAALSPPLPCLVPSPPLLCPLPSPPYRL